VQLAWELIRAVPGCAGVRLTTGPRGGVSIERRLVSAGRGRVSLAQTFRGSGVRAVVTHGASIATEIRVMEGALSFPLAGGEVAGPTRFLLVVPPRSALRMRFAGAWVESVGTAILGAEGGGPAFLVPGAGLADGPEIDPVQPVGAGRIEIDADRGVERPLRAARAALHELVTHPAPVRAAARRVGVAPETLTRGFSRAYGLSPKQYCQRARVFEAVLRLLAGEAVIEAGLAAGFADLGRFYAAFRRIVGSTPGVYARIRNRQDRPP
jgi:AraC-like DNA-binding protein